MQVRGVGTLCILRLLDVLAIAQNLVCGIDGFSSVVRVLALHANVFEDGVGLLAVIGREVKSQRGDVSEGRDIDEQLDCSTRVDGEVKLLGASRRLDRCEVDVFVVDVALELVRMVHSCRCCSSSSLCLGFSTPNYHDLADVYGGREARVDNDFLYRVADENGGRQ